jgi:hypothetical protein
MGLAYDARAAAEGPVKVHIGPISLIGPIRMPHLHPPPICIVFKSTTHHQTSVICHLPFVISWFRADALSRGPEP